MINLLVTRRTTRTAKYRAKVLDTNLTPEEAKQCVIDNAAFHLMGFQYEEFYRQLEQIYAIPAKFKNYIPSFCCHRLGCCSESRPLWSYKIDSLVFEIWEDYGV